MKNVPPPTYTMVCMHVFIHVFRAKKILMKLVFSIRFRKKKLIIKMQKIKKKL